MTILKYNFTKKDFLLIKENFKSIKKPSFEEHLAYIMLTKHDIIKSLEKLYTIDKKSDKFGKYKLVYSLVLLYEERKRYAHIIKGISSINTANGIFKNNITHLLIHYIKQYKAIMKPKKITGEAKLRWVRLLPTMKKELNKIELLRFIIINKYDIVKSLNKAFSGKTKRTPDQLWNDATMKVQEHPQDELLRFIYNTRWKAKNMYSYHYRNNNGYVNEQSDNSSFLIRVFPIIYDGLPLYLMNN